MSQAGGGTTLHALIVCNGERPSAELLRNEEALADLVVYTDGAIALATGPEHRVDAVIGDLDSLPAATWGLRMFDAGPHEEQSNSDSEKAVLHVLAQAEERGAAEVTIRLLGATGSRIDHSLANIQLCAKYAGRAALTLVSDLWELRAVAGTHRLEVPPGTAVSLLPLCSPCRLRTAGLLWEVDGELEPGTRGLSNCVPSGSASVEVLCGIAAVVVLSERALRHAR